MKKSLAIFLIVVLTAMLIAVPVTAAPASSSAVTQTGEAVKVETGPAIDGNIDDVWGQATAYPINLLTDGAGSAMSSGTFKVLWNPTTMYILLEVPDDTPFYEHADAYQRDGVEVKFDLQNLKTETYGEEHQFRLTAFRDGSDMVFEPQSSTWDDSAFTFGYSDTPGKYVVEMSVNMAKFPLSDDMMLGLDCQINDNAEDLGRTACLAWNDDANQAWQNPSYLGNMKLLAGVAAAPAVIEPVVEEAAAPTVEAAPAPTPAPAPAAAPKTADPITLIALGSIISAAGVIIAKKRK